MFKLVKILSEATLSWFGMVKHFKCFLKVCGFLIAWIVFLPVTCYASDTWGPYRGATASAKLSERDFAEYAKTGGNLLRISFDEMPLMDKTPPYALNKAAFEKLDVILDWGCKYGIDIVVDPHTTPGTRNTTNTRADDDLWKSYSYHEHLISLWSTLANRLRNRGSVVAGYDLLNEPASPKGFPRNGPADWNELAEKLITAIREHDKVHWIIIEPPIGRSANHKLIERPDGMAYLAPPSSYRLLYSPHIYIPRSFTHQGVLFEKSVEYPGKIDGEYWDINRLEQGLAAVIEYQKKYNVPIYIGEFSASRYAGESGRRYVSDLIKIFEKHGWSWSYHAWRRATVWDSENPSSEKTHQMRTESAPMIAVLRGAYLKNPPLKQNQVICGVR